MRIAAYVDGFNLYYRALRKGPHKWLDLPALARSLVAADDRVEIVRYFTARISPRAGDPDAPRRQQIYLSALATLPEVTIHYGRFLPKTKWRPIVHPGWDPHVFIEVHDTEEKGSDVNLASHLLNDAWRARFEAALVFSQDTDLCEPIRMVARDLGKPVGIVCLDGREPNKRLMAVSSFVRHITGARLAAAQFPDPVVGKGGKRIRKPETWRGPADGPAR